MRDKYLSASIITMSITKTCPRCSKAKLWKDFDKRPNGKPVSYCKTCRREYYHTDHKEQTKKRVLERKRGLRAYTWSYLRDNPCVDCGEGDPIVLEFDHVDPSCKSGNVSKMVSAGRALTVLQEEIAKCEIRCSNCHKRRTAKQFGWYKDLPSYSTGEEADLINR